MRFLLMLASLASLTSMALAEEPLVTGRYVLSIASILGQGPSGNVAFELITQDDTISTAEECLNQATEINIDAINAGVPILAFCIQEIEMGQKL